MTLRLYELLAALIVLLGAGWGYGHYRYEAGRQNRIDYYEPIMKAASDAKIIADTHARDLEHTAQSITDEVNHDAEAKLASIATERDAALASLREYQARPRRLIVPAVPGSAGVSTQPAQVAQCDRANEIAIDAAANGQSDAVSLSIWQQWYDKQLAAFNQFSQESHP